MSGPGMFAVKWEGVTELKGYMEAQRLNQLPFALSVGLNDVAFEIRRTEIDLINKTFDRPKPQTAKNVFVKKATKANPRAVVQFDQIWKGLGIDEYMEANIRGGARSMKPGERRLGRFYVPGDGAKMDKYGNMQGGQVTQILSRLGRFGDVAGYDMNQTSASKLSRRKGTKSTEYVMITQQRGGLKPGIYQRTQRTGTGFGGKTTKNLPAGAFQKGRGNGRINSVIQQRGLLPIMIFVKKAPTYKAVWPFYTAAQDVADTKMVPYLERAIERALRTAGYKSGWASS